MGRPSLTAAAYRKLAQSSDLQWVGDHVPKDVRTATKWKCKHCGNVMSKTYRAVQNNPNGNGCSCQNGVNKSPDDYYALAAKLGIEWAGKSYSGTVPKNTKTPTIWLSRVSENPIEATYQQVGYGKMTRELQSALEIEESTLNAYYEERSLQKIQT